MRRFLNDFLIVACSLMLSQELAAQKADLILVHGKIFTSDTNRLFVEALAIKGNRILAVGTSKFIETLASSRTRRIDLQGKTVVPGFNDAHDHLGWLAPVGSYFFTEFSVPGPSRTEVADSLARLVDRTAPGHWIQGTIGLSVFKDTSARRRWLDSLAPRHPVVLETPWGHGMIVNTVAMQALGISETAADPLSGWYERYPATNRLSGALYEGTQFPFWQATSLSDTLQLVEALRQHAKEELAFGITTVQNMSATLQGRAARQIFASANLPVRTRIIAMPGSTDLGRNLAEWKDSPKRITALTYVSGIKYVIDGTPFEQTALMTKPYSGTSNYGRLNYPLDTIRQILREALTSDRQLLMHVVGDSATGVVLNLMKELADAATWQKKRVRIEHGSGIRSESTEESVRELGIVIVHTPQYGSGVRLRSRWQKGIRMAIGPDAVINPFLGIQIMTSRQPDPRENLSREQAVIAYTLGSAFAEFSENEKGRLMKGMLADMAILSQDIFTVPAAALPATRSLATIVDGKIVYRDADFSDR